MALAVNPSIGQAQQASVNPYQQRNEDQVRTNARREGTEPATSETRPSSVSAARTQESETRNLRQRDEDRDQANSEARDTRQGQTRGSVVDIRV